MGGLSAMPFSAAALAGRMRAGWPAPDFPFFEAPIMAKAITIKVKLVSSADAGFYYVAKKNSRTMTDKLVKTRLRASTLSSVKPRSSKIAECF
jgi:large subunit ribosomal protein L33